MLAYGLLRGDNFVAVKAQADKCFAMPVHASDRWQDYDFDSFIDDGLTVVSLSENSVVQLACLPGVTLLADAPTAC